MKYGTSISLSQEDIEKLEYIAEKNNFHSANSGMTAIIRFAIKKAYAHQVQLDQEEEDKKKQEELPSIPIGGISQDEAAKQTIASALRKRLW